MSGERILIVDDSESGRYIKAHILERAGFTVRESGTARNALTEIENWQPQLVMLDVKLPDANGLEVCRQIKREHPEMLVVQTSAAFVTPEDRAAGLEGGADSYLVEPIDAEELQASIRALVRQTSTARELREKAETLDRKLEEEIRGRTVAEDTLRHALKLDALGQLTGGIAHDFNNLLTVVLGSFTLIERTVKRANGNGVSAEQLSRYIDSGRKAAADCEYLTRRLLSFARRGPLSAEIVDLNSTILDFSDLLRRAAGERVEIAYALAPQSWTVRMDPGQFEAALLNLVVNARDAMPNGGVLTVTSANVTIPGPSPLPLPDDLPVGDYVAVGVTDTGTGMSEDVLTHALEPFFTTKDVGRGTGLGLSQVYGFAKQSNGGVGLSSRMHLGTTISLLLPRSGERAVHADGQGKSEPVPRGRETVLVVEDNELVLGFIVETLQELGYHVLKAIDGASALEVLDAQTKDVDLLFTDVVMPNNMTGIDLAARARRLKPHLKVLLTSGHMPDAMRETARRSDFEYIPKPYNPDELARRLRSVLSS